MHCWFVIKGILLTIDRLTEMQIQNDGLHSVVRLAGRIQFHIFLQCNFVISIWKSVQHNLYLNSLPSKIGDLWLTWQEHIKIGCRIKWDLTVMIVVWILRYQRNNFLFNNKSLI